MEIDYTDKKSITRFGIEVLQLPIRAKIEMTAFVVSNGLMLPKDIGSKALWWAVKFAAKRRGKDAQSHYAFVLSNHTTGQKVAEVTIDQMVEWMVEGKDATDPRSAGGFNDQELSMIRDCYLGLIS